MAKLSILRETATTFKHSVLRSGAVATARLVAQARGHTHTQGQEGAGEGGEVAWLPPPLAAVPAPPPTATERRVAWLEAEVAAAKEAVVQANAALARARADARVLPPDVERELGGLRSLAVQQQGEIGRLSLALRDAYAMFEHAVRGQGGEAPPLAETPSGVISEGGEGSRPRAQTGVVSAGGDGIQRRKSSGVISSSAHTWS